MKACILTDFTRHDEAYSLCRVVANQVRMIHDLGGYAVRVIVNQAFNQEDAYPGAEVIGVDPGPTGTNTVEIVASSPKQIKELTDQLRAALDGVGVVLTHDLLFQANMWKWHVACRRIARERPDIQWLHWVHSVGAAQEHKLGQFEAEVAGVFPNSKLVVMHVEERMRKMATFGYQPHQTVIVPNPLDVAEGYHPLARGIVERYGLYHADCIALYPCRLDRGKQPHILIEIFAELVQMGLDARVIVADFHSLHGDKEMYRDEMKRQAEQSGVPVYFVSDYDESSRYEIPHRAIMDLFDFADVFVHPSQSESDPLILPEAAWKRNALVLNFDLPLFRLWQGHSLQYQFGSYVDVATGMQGETKTEYGDRRAYMAHVAGGIAYTIQADDAIHNHIAVRKERSLQAVWERHLWPTLAALCVLDYADEKLSEDRGLASIIIPCYLLPDKDGELLMFTKNCLKSIHEHLSTPYEIIFVDNGSEIGADWLEAHADIYIRNDENLGYGPAVNQGLAAAHGDWLIVCNNDIEFVAGCDWIEKAVGAWHEDTGIISSHLLDHDPAMRVGREVPPHFGYFFGALWMISRAVYEEVGGLDEQFERGMFEDKDLVLRIMETGKELVKIGHVKHIGNATWGKLERQDEIYQANKARFEAKWPNR